MSKSEYKYYWFIVSTRTFYYSDTSTDINKDPDEYLALLLFVDLFNHAGNEYKVVFSTEAYNFTAKTKIAVGKEIYTSYSAYSNDFLLVEYRFVLE